MTSVEIERLRFGYGPGAFVLDLPRLRLDAGEVVACIGPSGSGKTTLVNLLAGIDVPQSGSVRLDGVAMSALPDAARRAFRLARIGLLFQELELLDYLSALDNVLLPFHLAGRAAVTAARIGAARALAASMGLTPPLLERRPAQLSQGERQRVALCRALVTEPSLVLCDEPTGNLDPRTATTVLDLLLDEVRRRGATLLMVTHDHALLPRFDRVIDMSNLCSAAEAPG
ncbi:MAG: ABC transporter ATP-binding protein [Planctomycetota bacterium]